MLTLTICAIALSVAAPAPKEAPKKEDSALVGEWTFESGMSQGKAIKDLKPDDVRLVFTDKNEVHVIVRVDNKVETLTRTYAVDASKQPTQLDMFPPPDEDEPQAIGIYKLEKDTLTICLDEAGKVRPNQFDAPADKASISLMKFKRLASK